MKVYSPYFKTLYDEQAPVGKIGRGSHYSIIECIQWKEVVWQTLLEEAKKKKIAVIWDEDHDERIIPIIESLYIKGLLAPVKFIGERKGHVSIILHPFFKDYEKHIEHIELLEKVVSDISDTVHEDSWSTDVSIWFENTEIIQDRTEKVLTYLNNINLLWDIC